MIYLYVKTHNKTGLKYLGKTVKSDPHKYKGSGRRWRAHLRKHGESDYTTEILLATENEQELRETGIFFSKLWNIVESDEWANYMIECGDGGDTSKSPNYLEAMAKIDRTGKNNSMFGRSAIKEQNLKWYKNLDTKETIYVPEGQQPDGFIPGRFVRPHSKPKTEEHRRKIGDSSRGRKKTKETIEKLRASRSWYKEHSLETKKKMSKNATLAKGVVGPDDTFYSNIVKASNETGIPRKELFIMIKESSYGWKWFQSPTIVV